MTQTAGKSQEIIEIAKKLGAKGEIGTPEKLWGYGKVECDESGCIGCGKCEDNCAKGAIRFERIFDLKNAFKKNIPSEGSKKDKIMYLISSLSLKTPKNPVQVPELVPGYGRIVIDETKCIGCGNCERNCSGGVLHVKKRVDIR